MFRNIISLRQFVIGKKISRMLTLKRPFLRRRHAVRTNSSEVFDARHAYRAFFLFISGNSISIDGESFPRRDYLKRGKILDRTLLASVATDSRHSSTLEETGYRLQLRGTRTAAIEGTAMAGGSARFREKEGRRRGRGGRKRPRSG